MKKRKNQGISHIKRLQENLFELRVVCPCGHVKTIPVFRSSVICNHCGRKLKNDTKAYFKYQFRKKMEEIEDGGNKTNS